MSSHLHTALPDLTVSRSESLALLLHTTRCGACLHCEKPRSADGKWCVCVIQSTVSDASAVDSSAVNVASFNASLDGVLAWLRDADDTVSRQSPVANDIESLKEQFHHHEVRLLTSKCGNCYPLTNAIWHELKRCSRVYWPLIMFVCSCAEAYVNYCYCCRHHLYHFIIIIVIILHLYAQIRVTLSQEML